MGLLLLAIERASCPIQTMIGGADGEEQPVIISLLSYRQKQENFVKYICIVAHLGLFG
jgi:hypothetical protein